MSQAGPLIGEWEPYLSMREVAAWLRTVTGSEKWTQDAVRTHLRRVAPDALLRLQSPDAKGGKVGRWYTTRDRLRRAFADVWDELLLKQIEVEVDGE